MCNNQGSKHPDLSKELKLVNRLVNMTICKLRNKLSGRLPRVTTGAHAVTPTATYGRLADGGVNILDNRICINTLTDTLHGVTRAQGSVNTNSNPWGSWLKVGQ